jgi:tryptophanyl-tRNA synthetase
MVETQRPRVVSGIQASGRLHIGNYIGAISLWVENQKKYENYLFVADLHSLTVPEAVDPTKLRERVEEIFAIYIACGIDPTETTLFVQSEVPEHAELGWILTCTTPVGWLERSTQYKTKGGDAASTGAGLLCYPSLQAADILLYDADVVPVGDDQQQHVEITRSIARRFNSIFGETFTVPEALVRTSGSRIMGLDDPTAKMSKSVAEQRPGHAIGLLDPPNQVRKALMRSVTDSRPAVDFTAGLAPGVDNLLTIYEALNGTDRAHSRDLFDGVQYGKLKTAVLDVVLDRLGTIQERYHGIMDDPAALNDLLARGAEQARDVASPKVAAAYQAVGLRR